MRPLSAAELVRAWEDGHARTLAERALVLLAHACPDETWQQLAELPIGHRDARLLTLRQWTLGARLDCLGRCPACAEPLELTFSVADVRTDTATDVNLVVQEGRYAVEFRLPDSTDLVAVDRAGTGLPAARIVLRRCLRAARYEGVPRSVDGLPGTVLDAVVRRMAEADPQADVHTTLTCPSCTHSWEVTFDIVSFFWAELDTWALRTLRDVHRLACAYGWREADILELSPRRRQFYLQMVG